jgi:hypothetical protein
MAIEKLKCLRCNHEWYPRSDEIPRTCPNRKCHSPYWNKPRQKVKVEPTK